MIVSKEGCPTIGETVGCGNDSTIFSNAEGIVFVQKQNIGRSSKHELIFHSWFLVKDVLTTSSYILFLNKYSAAGGDRGFLVRVCWRIEC